MNYTILSATYSNPERTAAVLQTAEAGAVAISSADTPALWAAVLSTSQPAAYVAPTKPVPATISRFQLKAALSQSGLLTQADSGFTTATALAKLAWADSPEFRRSSPTVAALAAKVGLTSAQVDQLFIAASGIEA